MTLLYTVCTLIDMSQSAIKWVSPTGLTLMHEDGTYSFPSEPHPQLAYPDTSNKGLFGLKGLADTAMVSDDDMSDALALAG